MNIAKHILVATDFSEPADHALEYALDLAEKLDARLTVLHVMEVPVAAYMGQPFVAIEVIRPDEDFTRKQLAALMKTVNERAPNAVGVLRTGVPGLMLASEAEALGADLIVVGTHGRRGLSHLVLGSVAEKTLRHASVPVLVVHTPAASKAA